MISSIATPATIPNDFKMYEKFNDGRGGTPEWSGVVTKEEAKQNVIFEEGAKSLKAAGLDKK